MMARTEKLYIQLIGQKKHIQTMHMWKWNYGWKSEYRKKSVWRIYIYIYRERESDVT